MIIKYVPTDVNTCHHECPSSKKAAGHPMLCFQCVSTPQKMLSRFQIKKPNANMPAPLLNVLPIDDLYAEGMCAETEAWRRRYRVRKAKAHMMLAKTTW